MIVKENNFKSNGKKHLLADRFNDDSWVAKLNFLSDIFGWLEIKIR
jgi:hypothetical protein